MKKLYLILFILYSSFACAQLSTRTYQFQGIDRSFKVYVPKSYNNKKDVPLVIFLHGLGGDMNNFSGLTYKAEAEKYIMVVPQAATDPKYGTTWNFGFNNANFAPNKDIDDVAFLSNLIDSLSVWYKVDAERIYCTGFSIGGLMANRLGCELSEKIAAIASVSGTLSNNIADNCNAALPVLHIHSISDKKIPYTNNIYGIDAEELLSFWSKQNKCKNNIDTINLSENAADGFSSIKYKINSCKNNNNIEFYKLSGPSHNESFFTRTSNNDFDAIDVIWDFFERHKKYLKKKDVYATNKIVTNINQVSFDAFPNPASQNISLNFDNKVKLTSISIANTLGKIIDTKYYDEPVTASAFDVSQRAPGIYFFQIKDIEGNLTVMRFFKK